jgi:16S rRNA (cytosine1402-N4)-methyltransferase
MGGHSSAICSEHWDTLQLLMGIDQDPAALLMAGKRLHAARAEGRAVLVSGNFEDMGRLAAENGIEKESVDGILLDIGTSSLQLDEAERGFSFMRDGPLDMRMDPRQGLTAADIVNTWDETEIARVIYEYGEERKSRAIARKIVAARQVKPIETTLELCRVIGGPRHGKGIHPATLAFQGLRIAVNRELHVLEKALPQAVDLLRPGGRLAVISFHSLEDRIVKNWFLQVGQLPQRQKNKYAQFSKLESEEETNDEEGGGGGGGGRGAKDSDLVILTKRPIVAGECETHVNPRARSAKLRVLEKRPSS